MSRRKDEAMALAAVIPGHPNRAARKAAKRANRAPRGQRAPLIAVPTPAEQAERARAEQRRQQESYRRRWRQQLDALRTPDDDAYSVLRTGRLASELGTARPVTRDPSFAPALLRYLSRSHYTPPPAAPTNKRIRDALARYDPWTLARARLALAEERPDDSLVLELTGWGGVSEHDLARAFDGGGRSGWSQPSVHKRKAAALTWLREWLARGP